MPLTETDDEFVQRVRLKCVMCADCWVWQGARSHNNPAIKVGSQMSGVRRELLKRRGVDVSGKHSINTCETEQCVAPDHLAAVSRSNSIKLGVKRMPAEKRLIRASRISKKKRVDSALSQGVVDDIRQSPLSCAEEARVRGISKSAVIGIRSFAIWRDYNNPFIGLMK